MTLLRSSCLFSFFFRSFKHKSKTQQQQYTQERGEVTFFEERVFLVLLLSSLILFEYCFASRSRSAFFKLKKGDPSLNLSSCHISKVTSNTTFADGDVANNFNKRSRVLKVNESYDVGLDIAFHSVDKVKKVLLCVFRVACRATTSFVFVLGYQWWKQKNTTARFRSDFFSAYGIGTVSHLDATVLTFNTY